MNNQFISHQGKQQFKIQSFLQGRVFKAKKLNNSFLFHNSRMIALLKNGMLVYYSKCFKSSQQNADVILSKPKCGVYFNNTCYSCVKISEKEVELIVKFKKSQLYYFDDTIINYVKDPRSQDTVLWIFVIQIDDQLQKLNYDNRQGPDSLNSLYNCQFPCLEDQIKKKQISIDKRINTTCIEIKKKRVQWLDMITQQQIKESNTQLYISEQSTQNSKSNQQDDLNEIYEEKTDLKIKNIEIRMLSFQLNGSKKNIKIE